MVGRSLIGGTANMEAAITRPVMVVLVVSPCQVPEAGEALEEFERRNFAGGGQQFIVQFARWLSPSAPGDDCVCDCHHGTVRKVAGEVECVALRDASQVGARTIAITMTAIFPEAYLPGLADICSERGLIIVRGVLHAYRPASNSNIEFDWLATVAPWRDQLANLPAEEDVFTIEREECRWRCPELPALPAK